jgi:hypothetical protein
LTLVAIRCPDQAAFFPADPRLRREELLCRAANSDQMNSSGCNYLLQMAHSQRKKASPQIASS